MKKKEVVDESFAIITNLKQKMLNQQERLIERGCENIDLIIENKKLREKLEISTVNNSFLIAVSIIVLIFLILK